MTETPCILRDDRLDHGTVGHIAQTPHGRIGWLPSAADRDRWTEYESAQPPAVRLIAGFNTPALSDLMLEHQPRLRDQLADALNRGDSGPLAHFTVHRDGTVTDRQGAVVSSPDREEVSL